MIGGDGVMCVYRTFGSHLLFRHPIIMVRDVHGSTGTQTVTRNP